MKAAVRNAVAGTAVVVEKSTIAVGFAAIESADDKTAVEGANEIAVRIADEKSTVAVGAASIAAAAAAIAALVAVVEVARHVV